MEQEQVTTDLGVPFGGTLALKAIAERANAEHTSVYPTRPYCSGTPDGYVCFVARLVAERELKRWIIGVRYG